MKKWIFIFSIFLSIGIGYIAGKNSVISSPEELPSRDLSSIDHNYEFEESSANSQPPEVPVIEDLKSETEKVDEAQARELEARRIKNELEKLGFSAALEKDKKGRSIAKVQGKTKKPGKVKYEKDSLVDEVEWNSYGVPEDVEADDTVDLSTDHK